MHLQLRFITLDKDGSELPAGYYPPFHNLSVSGQYHSVFGLSNSNQMGIITAVEELGIIAHYSQPLG
jgi:hypothetical protein